MMPDSREHFSQLPPDSPPPGRRRRLPGRPHGLLAMALIPAVALGGIPLRAQGAGSQGAGSQGAAQPAAEPPPAVAAPPVPRAAPTAPPNPPSGAAIPTDQPPAQPSVQIEVPIGPGSPGAAPAPAAPAPALVAPAVAGKKILGLELKGLKTLSEETMLFYLGLKVGQTLDPDQLNRNIKKLWERGLIDDIRVDAIPAGADGVRLVITVVERPLLRSIEYEGLKRLSKTDIQDKIATQHIKVHE